MYLHEDAACFCQHLLSLFADSIRIYLKMLINISRGLLSILFVLIWKNVDQIYRRCVHYVWIHFKFKQQYLSVFTEEFTNYFHLQRDAADTIINSNASLMNSINLYSLTIFQLFNMMFGGVKYFFLRENFGEFPTSNVLKNKLYRNWIENMFLPPRAFLFFVYSWKMHKPMSVRHCATAHVKASTKCIHLDHWNSWRKQVDNYLRVFNGRTGSDNYLVPRK